LVNSNTIGVHMLILIQLKCQKFFLLT
jgi:hypothetical protein